MERVAFVMEIKPGCEEEYAKRHKAVFPELLEAFKRVGIQNYSIFIYGALAFAYLEADNYCRARSELFKEPSYRKWQEYMEPLMVKQVEGKGISRIIPVVFHLD